MPPRRALNVFDQLLSDVLSDRTPFYAVPAQDGYSKRLKASLINPSAGSFD